MPLFTEFYATTCHNCLFLSWNLPKKSGITNVHASKPQILLKMKVYGSSVATNFCWVFREYTNLLIPPYERLFLSWYCNKDISIILLLLIQLKGGSKHIDWGERFEQILCTQGCVLTYDSPSCIYDYDWCDTCGWCHASICKYAHGMACARLILGLDLIQSLVRPKLDTNPKTTSLCLDSDINNPPSGTSLYCEIYLLPSHCWRSIWS